MRRVMRVLGSAAGAAALVGLLAAPASAAKVTRASVSLACDRGASAIVYFTIFSDGDPPGEVFGTGPVPVQCGGEFPNHWRQGLVADDPGIPDVASVTLTVGVAGNSCSVDQMTLPVRLDCPGDGGAGVTVTVR